ncbi:Oidioi.mRNA.OKI2018_I69.PAR.g9244.t1.cds [Oikopleura dioica]|uniref:Oidioi.mRNA.OKI2018_I69.PAR.g9244.t1.cds n=1 Tax=Oikopleura dioica TaxID=34765 RepID=A0ABN7RKP7_OIKDI|nr:Oidioi.mRNA.OKI2018_I69.PAR.g9244.t1.cds [Oikopleura dioica]
MYRVMVFFWILCGLVWLGGVISIMTEMIRHRGKSLDDEKQKNEENEEKKDKNLRQQSTKRLNNGSLQKVVKV